MSSKVVIFQNLRRSVKRAWAEISESLRPAKYVLFFPV
uniref:Uncharacterized protein n=1 Tax=Rhizophora mucronata TaxID=61149 RepID=A0A2P2QGI9_RHIMU